MPAIAAARGVLSALRLEVTEVSFMVSSIPDKHIHVFHSRPKKKNCGCALLLS
jgi:hypothetical protein